MTLEANEARTISTLDGLVNNAVYSVAQDRLGRLWIGTADGLHIWSGHGVELYKADDGRNYFSGNTIRSISSGPGTDMWLRSDYGIARLDTKTGGIDFYDALSFSFTMVARPDSLVYVIGNDNMLYRYDYATSSFNRHGIPLLPKSSLCNRIIVNSQGHLYCFTEDGIFHVKASTDFAAGGMDTECIRMSDLDVAYAAEILDGDICWFVTEDNLLCRLSVEDGTVFPVADMSGIFPAHEDVRSILPAEGGLNVGFSSRGVFFLPFRSLENGHPELEPTPVRTGIFCMYRDRNQPIVWVGTDGRGLVRWSRSSLDFDHITYDELPYSLGMPVRSIFLDRENNLWFGTKGDGIVILKDYVPDRYYDMSNTLHMTASDSELLNNNVYALSGSHNGFIWIGSDGPGLNCWDYGGRRIRKVPGSEGIVGSVHSLLEQNDSTLWVTADYGGAYKCIFRTGNDGVPSIVRSEKVDIPIQLEQKNRVFTMTAENDSILWFGTRGTGAIRYNMNSGYSRMIRFPVDKGYATNVISYISPADSMLFATGSGLVSCDSETGGSLIHGNVPNRVIHAILRDEAGNIWLSTNTGVIFLDEKKGKNVLFDQNYGLRILEFSDGACFRDTLSGAMFFGGINGILSIRIRNEAAVPEDHYEPELHVLNLIADGVRTDVSDLMSGGKLRLHHSGSQALVEISVIDNLHYPDYEFFYCLDGNGTDWQSNGNSDLIPLPPLGSGNHVLKLRWQNKAMSLAGREYVLPIYVIPPVYARWWAILFYALAFLCLLLLVFRYFRGKYLSMKENLRRRYADEINRTRSETVRNITDELSVLVTFILGLCQQLRQKGRSLEDIDEKTGMIEQNVDKISRIMYMMNEYSKLQTMNAEGVSFVPVGRMTNEIIDLIRPVAENRHVVISSEISPDLVWAVNKDAWLTLLDMLISSSVEYAAEWSGISVSVKEKDDELLISVAFVCEKELYENLCKVSDRHEYGKYGNVTDGLLFDFMIVYQLTAALDGKVSQEWDEDLNRMCLVIHVPKHPAPVSGKGQTEPEISACGLGGGNGQYMEVMYASPVIDARLDNIFLVSGNKEIRIFFRYFFSSRYNVCEFSDNQSAIAYLDTDIPVLAIYDVSSSGGMDGIREFMDAVRGKRLAGHLQTVALISALGGEERYECIRLGIDICISFPFNIEHVQASIDRLISKRRDMDEYYNSPVSSFTVKDSRILHHDDKLFLKRLLKAVDDNIQDPDLSVMSLAARMQMSVRVLYRRLESITDTKPQKIIRDRRMGMAARMLRTSKSTVDEIMYKVGYDNRSTFYKNFRECYGVTPKEYRDRIKDEFTRLSDRRQDRNPL